MPYITLFISRSISFASVTKSDFGAVAHIKIQLTNTNVIFIFVKLKIIKKTIKLDRMRNN